MQVQGALPPLPLAAPRGIFTKKKGGGGVNLNGALAFDAGQICDFCAGGGDLVQQVQAITA